MSCKTTTVFGSADTNESTVFRAEFLVPMSPKKTDRINTCNLSIPNIGGGSSRHEPSRGQYMTGKIAYAKKSAVTGDRSMAILRLEFMICRFLNLAASLLFLRTETLFRGLPIETSYGHVFKAARSPNEI